MATSPSSSATPADPSVEITIAASVERVWELLVDLSAMARRSPQVVFSRQLGSGAGSWMINLNRRGPFFWPTTARVTVCEPPRRLAFRINENRATWSFDLEPTEDGGTHVIHRRDLSSGTTALSRTVITTFLGGQETFADELAEGMSQTLTELRREAESGR